MDLENIVIEGGGVRAIAYVGAVKHMEELGILQNIKRFAGSSGGAIVAGALAVGYNAKELEDLMVNTDFMQFKDDKWGIIRDLWCFFKRFGYMSANRFYEWYGELLAKKTGNPNITFKELYDKYGKVLVLTGMCVNKRELHLYHHESNPDMKIRLAARISMGLPFVFAAIKWKNDILIDGGTLNNYPLYVFDNEKLPNTKETQFHFNPRLHNKDTFNKKTLGLKLLDNNENDEKLYTKNVKIKNIIDFTSELINGILLRIEKLHVQEYYWERTVKIQTGDIDTVDFGITQKEKEFLISEGYKGSKLFFSQNS